MKTIPHSLKNFLVFLFFVFTNITFAQSNNCAATPTLTIGTTCSTTNYNVVSTFTDSGVAESCTGTSHRDGWFTFTTGASTTLITINGTSNKRLGLALYTGACGSLSEVICTTPGTADADISNQIVLPNTTYRLRLMRTNNDNSNDMTGTICVIDTTPAACTGTPTAGTTTVSPTSGAAGSTYTVSNFGHATGSGITYQWQSNTNGAGWVNVGASSGTYSNYSATAPGTIGSTVAWQLVVTCTNSGQSATSTNSTFTVVSTLNIPISGSNNVACGTNITLYDNGGAAGNYASNSTGYTVLEAGLGTTINISGSYATEGSTIDYIRIFNGTGTGGTILATYSGTGTINYTGIAGQTLTVQFYSDGSIVNTGFNLSVTYTGVCFTACSGTPTGGTVTTLPNTGWPGSSYVVSATGYTQALNMSYQWQYSTDAGTSWNNAGAATSSYSNYTATAPASGVVVWRLRVTCTNSSQTANSTTATFTTMAVSNVATGCPNVVTGGLGLNGADPAPFDCTATATCVALEATYLDLGNTTNYIVEPIAYNPPFAFTGLANPIVLGTDDYWSSQIVDLPFKFCYFGNTYEQVLPGPNGALTFDTSLVGAYAGYSFSNNLPSTTGALFNNTIYGVYHDINSTYGGQFGWELVTLSTGCRALVVAYNNVPMFSNNAILYSGMIVLYENSNIIEIYVKEKKIDNYNVSPWNGGNAIIGLQNSNGTLAVVPPGRNGLDPNWEATGEAWRFVPNGTSIASIAWYEGPTASGPVLGTNDILNVCPTATTTYTAEITYTLCDGRTIKEYDQTTVTVNGAKVWNGSVNTDWNVANNWTPIGVPTALDCVVIADTANDPIISGTNYNGLGLNLTVNNNATLTVTPNNDLTITEWVNINPSGDLVLQNSASLIQIDNDVNQGTMHMTRTANIRKLDYVYWSSPVTSFSVNSISSGTTGYKYKWIPTIPSNTNGWGNWANANENMVIGKGYIVRGPDSFTSTITPFNAVFTGTPNNGTITTPIARGGYVGANYMAASSTLATEFDDNWNLIGNPYPSSINAINFLTANPNINGFINIWTHGTLPSTAISDPFYNDYAYNYTSNDYITYNSSGASTGPSTFGGYIGAGQGFFVLMNNTNVATTENVTFNNTMRSSAYDNAQFFRASDESGRIWLDLIASNGNTVRNLVAYVDGATNNKDRMFDAIGSEKLNFNLYSTIGNEIMKIQGRTLPFDQEDRVPMGIKVAQNGNYTIGIGAVDGFFTNTNQNIYLEDLENNIIHDLRQNPYSFSSDTGNYPNRFVLRYTNETLGGDDLIADEANLWVFSNDNLTVKSTKNSIQSIRVFDILGRHLADYPNVNSYEVPLNKIQKNNAGLIIQVTLSNGTVVNKKVIY